MSPSKVSPPRGLESNECRTWAQRVASERLPRGVEAGSQGLVSVDAGDGPRTRPEATKRLLAGEVRSILLPNLCRGIGLLQAGWISLHGAERQGTEILTSQRIQVGVFIPANTVQDVVAFPAGWQR